jgi:hypothetical protein
VTSESIFEALRSIAAALRVLRRPFAVVGGMAVAVRGEPRFTRDVDVAVAIASDVEIEGLVFELTARGYRTVALVEHGARNRLSTARLAAPGGMIVDLIAATCGIEQEIVERALPVALEGAGELPVARAEELLAMKVLSMTERRPLDRVDAISLVLTNPDLDLQVVRANLQLILERGFDRGEKLIDKLDAVLAAAEAQRAG